MKKAYSWHEIKEMGFEPKSYPFPEEAGSVEATLVIKRWGNNTNIICYFEDEGGTKFKLCAWWDEFENRAYRPRDSDIDFTEVELGTRLRLEYEISSSGKAMFINAELIGAEKGRQGGDAE